jgi:hypothetical protein
VSAHSSTGGVPRFAGRNLTKHYGGIAAVSDVTIDGHGHRHRRRQRRR